MNQDCNNLRLACRATFCSIFCCMLQSPQDSGLWGGPLGGAGGARLTLRDLAAHAGSVGLDAEMREARGLFNELNVAYLAVVSGGAVAGLCSRAQVGMLLGSEFGFAVFGRHRVREHMVSGCLCVGAGTPLRDVLDQAVARRGEAFYHDVVVVEEAQGSLVGLVPMEALIRAQGQLVAEQFEALGRHRMDLGRINADLMATVDELNMARSRYATLFESAALAVAVLTADGAIEEGNTLLCGLLGMDAGSGGRGGRVPELMEEGTRAEFLSLLGRLLDGDGGQGPIQADFRMEIPGRGSRIIEVHMRAIPGAGRVCACLEDTTERREFERLLAQREKHALMETLVGGIAHELNNKLLPILGFVDLMKADVVMGAGRERLESYCERIALSAQAAAKIVRALLQMSKPGFDELVVFDLRTVAREAMEMVGYRVRKAEVATSVAMPESEVWVLGDPAQMHQLFVNLFLNACDAMEGRAERCLGLSLEMQREHTVVHVSDTGCGIPEEVMGRIFDPFFTTKGPQRGTGLGLTICFGIARRHHGVISVDETGSGRTVFRVELPLAKVPGETEKPERAAISEGQGVIHRALVVEDDRGAAAFFVDALRGNLGCQVALAVTGEEGRRMLEANGFDLVLCDIRMPGMSGLELLEWAIENRPQVARRFIMVTGDEGTAEGGPRAAELKVLRKPFTVRELLDACQRACRVPS